MLSTIHYRLLLKLLFISVEIRCQFALELAPVFDEVSAAAPDSSSDPYPARQQLETYSTVLVNRTLIRYWIIKCIFIIETFYLKLVLLQHGSLFF